MKVEGVESISNYYTFVYNKNAGKTSSNGETEDEFKDFDSFKQISDNEKYMDDEEHTSPQRKKGMSSQVITLPDGSRYLITTMYFCGKEIKITKKLPSIDKKEDEEDELLRQDNDDNDDEKNWYCNL